jgi:hypothetical protein
MEAIEQTVELETARLVDTSPNSANPVALVVHDDIEAVCDAVSS